MIENVQIVGEGDVIIEAEIDGVASEIKFSDIAPFWEYANEEDYESGRAYVYEDYIAFTMLTHSGQGGIIVVWDTNDESVVHISEAAYCQALSIFEDNIYYLCDVSNFVTPSHIQLYSVPLFTMDASESGERIYCEEPSQFYNQENPPQFFEIDASDSGIIVMIDEEEVLYSSSLDEEYLTSYNDEYSWLYDHSSKQNTEIFGWLT